MITTEEMAKAIGEPLELCNGWRFVMNTLWAFFVSYSKVEKSVTLVNSGHSILFSLADGHKYEISVRFYNRSYLCLEIQIEGNTDFECKVSHIDKFGKEGIIKTVSSLLTYAENVK